MRCWPSSRPWSSSAAAVWEALWGSTPIITGMGAPFSRVDRKLPGGQADFGPGQSSVEPLPGRVPAGPHNRSGASPRAAVVFVERPAGPWNPTAAASGLLPRIQLSSAPLVRVQADGCWLRAHRQNRSRHPVAVAWGGGESVAEPTDGDDVLRVGRIAFDPMPKPFHVGMQVPPPAGEIGAPDQLDEPLAGDRLARVAKQDTQQLEFLVWHLDRLPANPHCMRPLVQDDI